MLKIHVQGTLLRLSIAARELFASSQGFELEVLAGAQHALSQAP